jgi:hypothetical protein
VNGHEIALWSAFAAGFGYLVALGLFDLFDPARWIEYLGALIAAGITGGAVYSKQRLDDAKKKQGA